jgi:lysophospholipase L1-like esterase
MQLSDKPPIRGRRLRGTGKHTRRTLSAAALALSLPLLLTAACSSPHNAGDPTPKPTPTPTPHGPYVALGDSYTSGPDIPNQTGSPSGCDRSSRDYPALVAQHFKFSTSQVSDVSCSGATIADLTTPQATGNGTNPAQVSALRTNTALVTVGIGGNDLDFAGTLTRCVELDAPATLVDLLRHATPSGTPCRDAYTAGGDDQIGQKIQASTESLAAALARIRQLAPHARVLIVGYPDLFPTTDAAKCASTLGITPGDVSYLDNEELKLNSMLKQQAAAAHDAYVDTYSPSVGHDACSAASTRWIEPLLTNTDAAPLHPNAVGEQGLATALEHALTSATTSY